MADTLDLLEDRIAKIERRVFGQSNPSPEDLPQTPITESLVETGRNLTAAVTGHDKAYSIMKRVKELNNLLEMSFEDPSVAAKQEVLLLEEAKLYSHLSQLEQAHQLTASILDNPQATENLKAVNGLSSHLDKLSLLTANSVDDYNMLNEQVQKLFNQYNTIVGDLKQSFLFFNEVVSTMEAAAHPPKVLD